MKSVMSGQRMPFRCRIESAFSLLRARRNNLFPGAQEVAQEHRRLLGYLNTYLQCPVEKMRVLDMGCGQTAAQTALFQADGADAVGIDVEVPTYRMNLSTFFRTIRLNGPERALKSLVRHLLVDKRFFAELAEAYGKPIPLEEIDTRVMDATRMTFESESFDFIFSRSVFEHMDNVEAAVKEMNRVLRPDGIAVVTVHLFPCLSGGHSAEWIEPDRFPSTSIPLWDHLRENRFPANTYLNKLTIGRYREIFRAQTEVLKELTWTEGEKLLTKEIEEELRNKGYTREDLLTSTIIFCVKKKSFKGGAQ